MLKSHKIVKYRVTAAFACLKEGEVINAVLVNQDGDSGYGLIYHPKVRGECASFEIGRIGADNIWVSTCDGQQGYVNVSSRGYKFEEEIFGKRFKWKRKFFK